MDIITQEGLRSHLARMEEGNPSQRFVENDYTTPDQPIDKVGVDFETNQPIYRQRTAKRTMEAVMDSIIRGYNNLCQMLEVEARNYHADGINYDSRLSFPPSCLHDVGDMSGLNVGISYKGMIAEPQLIGWIDMSEEISNLRAERQDTYEPSILDIPLSISDISDFVDFSFKPTEITTKQLQGVLAEMELKNPSQSRQEGTYKVGVNLANQPLYMEKGVLAESA